MIDEYRTYKQFFYKYCEKFKGRNRYDLISEYSAIHMIPVITIFIYYGELYGFDEELKEKIYCNIKFYGLEKEDFEEYIK